MGKTISSLIVAISFSWIYTMSVEAVRDIPDDNLAYPVLIQGSTSGSGFAGSGFYLSKDNFIYLITARHLFFKASIDEQTKQSMLQLLAFDKPVSCLSYSKDPGDSSVNTYELDLKALYASGNLKKHHSQDVIVVRIGSYDETGVITPMSGVEVKTAAKAGLLTVGIKAVKPFEKVLTANEVFLFGYPTSLGLVPLQQYDYTKPLLRKGIIAGKTEKTKTLMIDLPAYPGDSGGPVLEVEAEGLGKRYTIIGVQSQLVPVAETVVKYGLPTQVLSHSGYSIVVSMNPVLELVSAF